VHTFDALHTQSSCIDSKHKERYRALHAIEPPVCFIEAVSLQASGIAAMLLLATPMLPYV
jgi:hypothetical protein